MTKFGDQNAFYVAAVFYCLLCACVRVVLSVEIYSQQRKFHVISGRDNSMVLEKRVVQLEGY